MKISLSDDIIKSQIIKDNENYPKISPIITIMGNVNHEKQHY